MSATNSSDGDSLSHLESAISLERVPVFRFLPLLQWNWPWQALWRAAALAPSAVWSSLRRRGLGTEVGTAGAAAGGSPSEELPEVFMPVSLD